MDSVPKRDPEGPTHSTSCRSKKTADQEKTRWRKGLHAPKKVAFEPNAEKSAGAPANRKGRKAIGDLKGMQRG